MKVKSFKKAKVVATKIITNVVNAKNICKNSGCLDACTCTGNCE